MIFIVMGVSGSGKTTVGRLLGQALRLPFYDADDFHSAANVDKMRSGTPLTDEDRRDWLATLAANLSGWEAAGGAVLACSALKEHYRAVLQAAVSEPIRWVVLHGEKELIAARIQTRADHYMSVSLLDSQFAAFEKPAYGLHLPIHTAPEELVTYILAHLDETTAATNGTT